MMFDELINNPSMFDVREELIDIQRQLLKRQSAKRALRFDRNGKLKERFMQLVGPRLNVVREAVPSVREEVIQTVCFGEVCEIKDEVVEVFEVVDDEVISVVDLSDADLEDELVVISVLEHSPSVVDAMNEDGVHAVLDVGFDGCGTDVVVAGVISGDVFDKVENKISAPVKMLYGECLGVTSVMGNWIGYNIRNSYRARDVFVRVGPPTFERLRDRWKGDGRFDFDLMKPSYLGERCELVMVGGLGTVHHGEVTRSVSSECCVGLSIAYVHRKCHNRLLYVEQYRNFQPGRDFASLNRFIEQVTIWIGNFLVLGPQCTKYCAKCVLPDWAFFGRGYDDNDCRVESLGDVKKKKKKNVKFF